MIFSQMSTAFLLRLHSLLLHSLQFIKIAGSNVPVSASFPLLRPRGFIFARITNSVKSGFSSFKLCVCEVFQNKTAKQKFWFTCFS